MVDGRGLKRDAAFVAGSRRGPRPALPGPGRRTSRLRPGGSRGGSGPPVFPFNGKDLTGFYTYLVTTSTKTRTRCSRSATG